MSEALDRRIRRYLGRHAERHGWPEARAGLGGPDLGLDLAGVDLAVVIPCLAEANELPQTLDSLASNPARERARTLVVCVVNNVEGAPAAQVEDNRQTLAALAARAVGEPRLLVVDASSPGRELPRGGGVGTARKVGLDLALEALTRAGGGNPTLASLDADTRVGPDYLGALRACFARGAWAARLRFRHRYDEGDDRQRAAMGRYELYLRYHELGLRHAGSPYAFVALGSAIACSAEAYVASGGMNRRQAAEDFYFLQQLAKTGPLTEVAAVVRPSSRPSGRVPFGTGQKVRELLGERRPWLLPAPRAYRLLGELGRLLDRCGERSPAAELLAAAEAVDPRLAGFLRLAGLERILAGLQRNAAGQRALAAQAARWFDGLKSLRLLHHLRDHGLADEPGIAAIRDLCRRLGAPAPEGSADEHDLELQQRLLGHLCGLLERPWCDAALAFPCRPVA